MFKASTSVVSRTISRACHEEIALRGFRALTTSTTSSISSISSISNQALRGLTISGPTGQQVFGAQHAGVRGTMTGFGTGFAESMGSSTISLPSNITLDGLVMTDEIYIPVTQAGRLLLGKSEEIEPTRRWRSWDRSQSRRRRF
mmetsp:Transcript_60480/g.132391  ORF Transcript_60480/g.132391 Transcript_60480/m.132391 type:complete len:144 (-) Transcript_60480:712-1143(-)